jgi:xanthine dehydrogenase accessory factor
LLCGAGDDAQPVVKMASLLGWNVTVLDGRSQWATRERFPEASSVRVASSLDGINVGESDAAVVMTHSYEQDRRWLTALLPERPRYLGLLGARHRSALLVSEAAAMLSWDVERVCERIFAPVGLDLGGDGADAIALAVVAEIQACCEGKLGVSRRMSAESVAEQIALGGASRYLQTQCAL